MQSIAKKIGSVAAFPAFTGQGVYMHKTGMNELLLPAELRDYVPVLDTMLSSLKDRAAVCYVTIDEKLVSNTTHRRAGVHVDHNWYEVLNSHTDTRHRPGIDPRWRPAPGHQRGNGGHGPNHADVLRGHSSHRPGMQMDEFNGGMLLTSNYPACQVWDGQFEGIINEGGCCKDIDLSGLSTHIMPANEVYYLNPLGIHESLPILDTVQRQLVRINFHPDYIPELV